MPPKPCPLPPLPKEWDDCFQYTGPQLCALLLHYNVPEKDINKMTESAQKGRLIDEMWRSQGGAGVQIALQLFDRNDCCF